MREWNFTDTERLILANQYDILAELKGESYYSQLAENLRDGHKWLYEQSFQDFSEVLPDEKVKHVLNILGIYSDMRDSYSELKDKTGIDEGRLRFPGFDGNNETDLLHFAKALLKNEKFELTLSGRDLNSHMPTYEGYARMIHKWKELGEPHYPYTREMIVAIQGEWAHPSRRG